MPTRALVRALALGAAVTVLAAAPAVATIASDGALPADAVAAQRYAGQDRYETAARTALQAHPGGAATAIIARGDAFPDGLAASYLAGAEDAPILLTAPDSLPLATQDALGQLGTQRAIIVGGPTAIDQTVEARLDDLLGADNVRRLSGQTRFDTAAIIFNDVGTLGTLEDLSGDSDATYRTVVVASGRSFPDALAAGPLAHAAGVPILLTEPTRLPDITRLAIETGAEQVLVAGGPVSISAGVVAQLRGISGVEVVERVAGPDRTATAAQLADLTADQLGWPDRAATVALGTDFPDALSLAPAASRLQAPILLTRSTSQAGAPTFAALQARCATIESLVVAGGPVAVDGDAERTLELATSCADITAALSGDAIDGGGDPEASGTAWMWTESLCYALRVQDLASPASLSHLHSTDDGSVVAVLAPPLPTTGDGLAVGCLTDDDVRDGTADQLRAALGEDPGQFRVDVHTADHPDGAVSGRLG